MGSNGDEKPYYDDYWPHEEYMVNWGDLTPAERRKYTRALNAADAERDMQRFLAKNPTYLARHLGGGHGRWVIPSVRFGAEYVADFVIGERHSFGHDWQLVELESPRAKMFTKAGDPTKTLNHAIRQIQDWRAWLHDNGNYASRRVEDNGLGLIHITGDCTGLIIMGRRTDLNDKTNARRRQMMRSLKIQIRTYDFLGENGECPIDYSFDHLGREY